MKKFKKALALSLAMAMGLSLVACGGGDTTETATTAAGGDDTTDTTPATEEVAELEMPSEEGDPIYVYSWNTELGSRLEHFYDAYPQYKDRVEYVNLGLGGTDIEYQTQIDTLLQNPDSEKYPSIIAADNDVALHWTQSEYTLPLADIGIGGDDLANMYDYTIQYATYNGQLKALTWQATPGVLCYRTDIAEEVLGSSDPAEVQKAVKDWDTFFETAETMKEKGYKMVSGPDDIKYPLIDSRTSPWVTGEEGSETLNIDAWVSDYLEKAKKLYDEDLTNKTSMWSDGWSANMDKDVFCYFGCTWFLFWSLCPDNEDGTNDYEHAADWNICVGPQAYHWGGTYLTVGKDCPDTALAALVLRTLCCDTDVMADIITDDSDFVNNKAAQEKVSKAGYEFAKLGIDPLETFKEGAEKISLDNATSYDAIFNGYVDAASQAYNAGTDGVDSVDKALDMVKNQVTENYSYITVE